MSIKNIRKSFRDYAVYFLTLVLGVTIFYLFNSLDSQTAMLELSDSKKDIVELLLTMLSMVSVFVAAVLGFLIIYANNFLIKRRKKEFGLYMLLGMGKQDISKILIGETLLVGLFSLAAGLVLGIFGSQLMSIIVAKMFEADMSGFTFVFSKAGMIKTVLYFLLMYALVLIFNAVLISRVKLIDLLNAKKMTERVKVKNPVISVSTFGISVIMLIYAYMKVAVYATDITESEMIKIIVIGCVATYLFFWSLSGFLLQFMKTRKNFYHKNLRIFVTRQLNSQVNTNVFSISIICLLLFFAICVLSFGSAMNGSLKRTLKEMTPRDVCCVKEFTDGDQKTMQEALKDGGFDTDIWLKEGYPEARIYQTEDLTYQTSLGDQMETITKQYRYIRWDTKEDLVPLSDYNAMASFYGIETYDLAENEFLMVCSFDGMKQVRDLALKDLVITIDGKDYQSAGASCVDGYLEMSNSHANTGYYVLPDAAFSNLENSGLKLYETILTADYAAETEEEKQEIENRLAETTADHVRAVTKISLYESSTGLSAIITFIALYLGIIFLISSGAILALKQLSDSADNKDRYSILRKIGADETMVKKALWDQIGIFFFLPLLLAIVHSVFGVLFCNRALNGMLEDFSIGTVILTAAVLLVVYGLYFLATYSESKRMLEEG